MSVKFRQFDNEFSVYNIVNVLIHPNAIYPNIIFNRSIAVTRIKVWTSNLIHVSYFIFQLICTKVYRRKKKTKTLRSYISKVFQYLLDKKKESNKKYNRFLVSWN